MVTWDAFYSFVRPNVQGCPLSYIDAAIRAATREFCEKTWIWNQETVCGDMLEGESSYRYNNLNDGVSIVAPIKVILREIVPTCCKDKQPIIKDHHLKAVNLQDMDRYSYNWRQARSDWPRRYYMKDSNTITFTEKPDVDHFGSIHSLAAVKPSQDAAGVPDFIFDDWAEYIAHGALVRLLSMDGRVWANLRMVQYHLSKFREGISIAKTKVWKSYTRQSRRIAPKPFI